MHTPGPWEIQWDVEFDEEGNEKFPSMETRAVAIGPALSDLSAESVCGTCDGCNKIKHDDALLISKAPDLGRLLLSLWKAPDWSDTSTDVVEATLRAAGVLT